ncbi:MAG: 50S ribosomal protein L22 [Symbiobacteriia bacterium]
MEAKASVRHVRIAPRKVRIVIDQIRGKSVKEAITLLQFISKRASKVIEKVIKSAAANAEHNLELNRDTLYVAEAFVDQGPTLKRFHPHQRGQAFQILKRTSHVTVVVREKEDK